MQQQKNIYWMWTLSKCILISYCSMIDLCTIFVMVIEVNFSFKSHATLTTQLWPKSEWTLSCEFVSVARNKMIYDKHNFQMVGSGLTSHTTWNNFWSLKQSVSVFFLKTNLHLVKASVSLSCSICLWRATRCTG